MSEYQKQADFLKALMSYENSEQSRLLRDRLCGAENNERCLLYACRLVGFVALMGVVGLGYSSVLVPEFFDNATHVSIQFFSVLGLGSMMCLAVFFGLWFWYRTMVNRIHDECRRLIATMFDCQFRSRTTGALAREDATPTVSSESATYSNTTSLRISKAA